MFKVLETQRWAEPDFLKNSWSHALTAELQWTAFAVLSHWHKTLLAFAVYVPCFLGLPSWASTLGIPRLTRNWVIHGPLRCIIFLGCFKIFHSHLKNLFKGTGCYLLFFNCHFYPLLLAHWTVWLPIILPTSPSVMCFLSYYVIWTMTIHGLLTVFWFLANYSWFMTPLIPWHKRLLSIS